MAIGGTLDGSKRRPSLLYALVVHVAKMKVGRTLVTRLAKEFIAGKWRLIPLRIERVSCCAMAGPMPEGGPWKATEVRRGPKGEFWLYLIKHEHGNLLRGDYMRFSINDVDYWLSIKRWPWVLDICESDE